VALTEAIVREHEGAVWRYLRFLGCDPALATELAQDTFLALLRARLPDRGAAALRGWLRGTARNLMRARRRQVRRELTGLPDDAIDAAWQDYEREDDGDGYRDALRACLAQLPHRQRHAVDLYWAQDVDLRELARALELKPEGAKTLLRRLKTALRHCIEQRIHHDDAR